MWLCGAPILCSRSDMIYSTACCLAFSCISSQAIHSQGCEAVPVSILSISRHCRTCPPFWLAGIRAIAGQEEPIGRQISKMEIAEGLVLEKVRS